MEDGSSADSGCTDGCTEHHILARTRQQASVHHSGGLNSRCASLAHRSSHYLRRRCRHHARCVNIDHSAVAPRWCRSPVRAHLTRPDPVVIGVVMRAIRSRRAGRPSTPRELARQRFTTAVDASIGYAAR
jgi:hypothetical protein